MHLFIDRLLGRTALEETSIRALEALGGKTSLARANIDIVSPGDSAEHACLIIDGLAGSFGQVIDGRRQITALHIAGDICDLHSLVSRQVGRSLQALSTTAILEIPHRDMRRVAKDHPDIAEAFWRDCAVDASILSQWVVNVGCRNAQSRLAHLLCEMAIRMESARLGTRHSFVLPASQTQLGDALGLTAVHINRTLQVLRADGLIATAGRTINIPDWDALVRLADFDERYLQVGTRNQQRQALAAA